MITAGGVSRSGLVRLNTDGSVDMTFTVSSLFTCMRFEFSGWKIIVGGPGLERLPGQWDGTDDTTLTPAEWDANADGSVPTTVQSITVQPDGKYLLSGSNLSSYNGVARFSVIRINPDGSLDDDVYQSHSRPPHLLSKRRSGGRKNYDWRRITLDLGSYRDRGPPEYRWYTRHIVWFRNVSTDGGVTL